MKYLLLAALVLGGCAVKDIPKEVLAVQEEVRVAHAQRQQQVALQPKATPAFVKTEVQEVREQETRRLGFDIAFVPDEELPLQHEKDRLCLSLFVGQYGLVPDLQAGTINGVCHYMTPGEKPMSAVDFADEHELE
jgi:hypothetical protein